MRLEDVQVKALASQVALQSTVEPSYTFTEAPDSQLPPSSGVESLKDAKAAGTVTEGAEGAVVSTVNVRTGLAALTCPTLSVWVAVRSWLPSVRALETQLKLLAPQVALQ